jgi:formylglycine-generating enzyme
MIPGIMAEMFNLRVTMVLCVLLLAGCVKSKERPDDAGVKPGDSKLPIGDHKVKPGDGKVADIKVPYDLPPVMPNPWKGETTRQGWARIQPGWFFMGSPTGELCHQTNEVLHKVTLTHEIEMMQAEATQGSYKTKIGFNPSAMQQEGKCGLNCPVSAVSWSQAVHYCNALSKEMSLEECYTCTGTPKTTLQCGPAGKFSGPSSPIYKCKGFRLPTEAEWEYAYRAGSSTAYYNGDDVSKTSCFNCSSTGIRAFPIAWYCGNSASKLRPIKGKGANRWLLYDMAGSIKEWVDDWYVENLGTGPRTNPWRDLQGPKPMKTLRGGSYLSAPAYIRAAYRSGFEPSSTSSAYVVHGFRCVRTLKF